MVSEEVSPAYLRTMSTILSNSQKQDIRHQHISKEEHLEKKIRRKSTEFCTKDTSFEDFCRDDEITGLSAMKKQERKNPTSVHLEQIFPYNSLQYSIQALKDIHTNILDLRSVMMESEASVKDIVIQYAGNKNLERQLLEVIEKYSQNQMEHEQRLHGMAHHLIEEQIQIIKSYKDSSQAHIEMLVNQKNAIEQENILLLTKLEKLHLKLKQYPEVEVHISDYNDIVLENNEKLRNKLATAHHTVTELQNTNREMLHSLERCADEIHNQKLEIERQKLIQIRNQKDLDAEKAYLCSELEKNKKCLQEATDIANVTIEDIQSLKTRLDDTGRRVCVNWERLEEEGATIASVLNVTHSFIHELGLEFINIYQDLTAKERELFTMKNNNQQLQKVMSELDSEYNILRQQCEQVISEKISTEKLLIKRDQENSDLKEQLSKYSHDITKLETEIVNLQELKASAKEQEVLKSRLEKNIEELKADKQNMAQLLLSDEKNGKFMEADFMKMTALLDIYENKNKELMKANQELEDQLEKVQKSCTNLQNIPQQYEQLEKKYYKEIAEKEYLNQQLNSLKTQLTEFSDTKSVHSKQIQNLESEYKKITKENLEMKWEVKSLKNINQCLEQDNCNMLHRLEEEAARHKHEMNEYHLKAQQLESQIEAHEKETGEFKKVFLVHTDTINSLQQECDEKNVIMNKLKEKCHDLHTLQQKDESQIFILNNRKQELENEITAITNNNTITLNSIKYEFEALETTLKITQDDLNNTMIKLQEKEMTLLSFQESLQRAESRLVEKEHQMIENLRTIEILQKDLQDTKQIKNHYAEMQELLKDHESIVQERDKLKVDKGKLLEETETLQQNLKEMHNKNETLVKYCSLQKEHIKGMKAQINKLQEYLTKVNVGDKENIECDLHQVTYELALHNNKSADLEYESEEYKFILDEKQNGNEEKSRLQSQVMLLHELHKRNSNDLKHAKRTIKMQEDKIMDLKSQLNEKISKCSETQKRYESIVEQQKSFIAEVETLQERIQQETQNCLLLTEEYYNYEKEMSAKEATLLETIQELKIHNERMNKEITTATSEKEDLRQVLENKQKEIILLKGKNEEMDAHLSDYGRTLSQLTHEKRKNEKLENQLNVLTDEGHNLTHLQQLLQRQHTDVTIALEDSRQELKRTREALCALEQLERQHAQKLHDIKEHRGYLCETSRLLPDIKFMEVNKLQVEQTITELKNNKECLIMHKKDLAIKLLKALKLIYQTKLKFKSANEKIYELSSQIKDLREQKALKENEVMSLTMEIAVLNKQVKHKNDGREKHSSEQLQKSVSSLQLQIEDLQCQLLKAKHKIQNDVSKTEALLLIKEDVILQCKEQIRLLQEKAIRLHTELVEAQDKLLRQNQDQSKLKHDMMTLQADKRDLSLKLQVIEGYLNEEKQHRSHLEDTYQKLLAKHSNDSKPL